MTWFLHVILQNILWKTQKSRQSALIIFTLVVYMNGWKEVTVVQYVARYTLHNRSCQLMLGALFVSFTFLACLFDWVSVFVDWPWIMISMFTRTSHEVFACR